MASSNKKDVKYMLVVVQDNGLKTKMSHSQMELTVQYKQGGKEKVSHINMRRKDVRNWERGNSYLHLCVEMDTKTGFANRIL